MASSRAFVASSGLAKVIWLDAPVGWAATASVGQGPIDSHPVRMAVHSVIETNCFMLGSIYPARFPGRAPPPPALPPRGWAADFCPPPRLALLGAGWAARLCAPRLPYWPARGPSFIPPRAALGRCAAAGGRLAPPAPPPLGRCPPMPPGCAPPGRGVLPPCVGVAGRSPATPPGCAPPGGAPPGRGTLPPCAGLPGRCPVAPPACAPPGRALLPPC